MNTAKRTSRPNVQQMMASMRRIAEHKATKQWIIACENYAHAITEAARERLTLAALSTAHLKLETERREFLAVVANARLAKMLLDETLTKNAAAARAASLS